MTIVRLGQLTAETQFTSDFLTDGASSPTISSTKAKTGVWSYRFGSNIDSIGLSFGTVNQFRAGCWINHIGAGGGANTIFRWYKGSGGSAHQIVYNSATDLIEIRISGSVVATVSASGIGFTTNDTWMHLGVNFKADAAGFCTFYLDGENVLTYSGNTAGDIASLYFGGQIGAGDWNNFAYFDDFYVDSAVGESDVPPPSKRFLFSLVNAAGADAAWTPSAGSNFQNVDDSGAPDGDTTHNAALSTSLKDTFNTASIAVPAGHEIRAAIILAIARRTDTGVASQIKLHSYDGVTYQSGAAQTPTISYNTLWERQVLQPDGSPWVESDLNLMQFGAESAGSF